MTGLTLKKEQAVELWDDMLWLRRELRQDCDFFRVPEFWEEMCEDNPNYRTRKVVNGDPNRAGILAFGDKATLIVTEEMWEKARRGCWLSNFTLAHEITHLARDHHAQGAVVKNFKLFDGPSGRSNIPPTIEEYETNIGAVFFQCGVALMDRRLTTMDLARRSCSDPVYVEKAQRIAQFQGFQDQIAKRFERFPRVTL